MLLAIKHSFNTHPIFGPMGPWAHLQHTVSYALRVFSRTNRVRYYQTERKRMQRGCGLDGNRTELEYVGRYQYNITIRDMQSMVIN